LDFGGVVKEMTKELPDEKKIADLMEAIGGIQRKS
jgi:hypothetical protein